MTTGLAAKLPGVRTRLGIVGGMVLVALAIAAPAFSQGQSYSRHAAPAAERLPGDPAAAKVKLQVNGASNGRIEVGERLQATARIRPFVPGQKAKIWLARAKKVVDKKTALIKQVGHKNLGEVSFTTSRLLEQGHYRIRVHKLPSPNQAGDTARSGETKVHYPDLDPGDRSNSVRLLNDLLDKQAYFTSHGSHYGAATSRAILAYRKVNGMNRTFNATPGILKKLAAGKGGFKLKWPEGGKHVEADLSRQVMVLADHGKAQHIFHISSGTAATPTVQGKFPVYSKTAGYNAKAMYYSVYFHGGYATHGYHDVPPTRPATVACATRSPTRSSSTTGWTTGTSSTSIRRR